MDKLEMQYKHINHILKLIARDRDSEGWAKVSETLFPHLDKNMPKELVELEKLEDGGRARLTGEGENVVNTIS